MIIIVGERPGPGRGGTTTSDHMASMIDVYPEYFLRTVRWTNVLDVPQEDLPATARAIEALGAPGDAIILLGREVAKAFGLDDMAEVSTVDRGRATIYLIPHPSGLNRWYNDADNRSRVARVLKRIWDEHRGGTE